jgi:D-sedoheptulose 7-phosphate isomerase
MQRSSDFLGYVNEQNLILQNINLESISRIVLMIDGIRHSGKTLWLLGNGGSAATSSHLVADLVKGANEEGNGPVRAIAIGEQTSLITAVANDIDYSEIFSKPISLLGCPGDGLLIFSVSGKSPNLINAATVARDKGLFVMSIVGQDGDSLQKLSDECILIGSRDYQIVENIHLTLGHWFMKELKAHFVCERT